MTMGGAWPNLVWACAACALLALSVRVSDSASAQELPIPDVRVSLVADRDELTVGDLTTLTLEVTHPADHAVVLPRLGPEWGPFEVRTQTPARTISAGDDIRTTQGQYQVTLFAPGEFDTPELSVSVRIPDGGVMHIPVPAERLTVRSVLSDPGDPLRDIRSHADLPTSFWDRPTTLVLSALSAFAAIGIAAYLILRRLREREATPDRVVDTRTPLEVATQELARIESLDLPGSSQFREHYTRVSALIRAYLQSVYFEGTGDTDAERMTTDEIEATLRLSSLDPRRRGLVCDLLIEADIVKYSAYTPPASVAREVVVKTRVFLDDSGPRPATPTTGGIHGGEGVPA